MKKISYLLTFSFIALFSLNSFATSTLSDLHLNKTPTTKTDPINPVIETITKQEETSVIVINNSDVAQQNDTPLNIAVSSNFKVAALHIAEKFSNAFGIQVNISSASTATLYLQILHGAPFDLFLSADSEHIQLLIEQEKVDKQLGFIYAKGQLVFWKPRAEKALTINDFLQYDGMLAIANPKFAPYGIAAQEVLEMTNKWRHLKYVMGNNINQTYQFVDYGNSPAGLVSYAAVIQKHQKNYIIIPQKWYQPIKQVGIILNNTRLEETNLFRKFILSDAIQLYIKSQGYN